MKLNINNIINNITDVAVDFKYFALGFSLFIVLGLIVEALS